MEDEDHHHHIIEKINIGLKETIMLITMIMNITIIHQIKHQDIQIHMPIIITTMLHLNKIDTTMIT